MFPITGKLPKPVDMFLTNRQIVDMFLDAILRTGSNQWTSSRLLAQVWISSFIFSCHVETVCLLTHSWGKRAEKAWNTGVSVTGASSASSDGNPLFMSAKTCQRRGGRLWIYYFRKRVNDFAILGKTRKRFFYLVWVETMSLLMKRF